MSIIKKNSFNTIEELFSQITIYYENFLFSHVVDNIDIREKLPLKFFFNKGEEILKLNLLKKIKRTFSNQVNILSFNDFLKKNKTITSFKVFKKNCFYSNFFNFLYFFFIYLDCDYNFEFDKKDFFKFRNELKNVFFCSLEQIENEFFSFLKEEKKLFLDFQKNLLEKLFLFKEKNIYLKSSYTKKTFLLFENQINELKIMFYQFIQDKINVLEENINNCFCAHHDNLFAILNPQKFFLRELTIIITDFNLILKKHKLENLFFISNYLDKKIHLLEVKINNLVYNCEVEFKKNFNFEQIIVFLLNIDRKFSFFLEKVKINFFNFLRSSKLQILSNFKKKFTELIENYHLSKLVFENITNKKKTFKDLFFFKKIFRTQKLITIFLREYFEWFLIFKKKIYFSNLTYESKFKLKMIIFWLMSQIVFLNDKEMLIIDFSEPFKKQYFFTDEEKVFISDFLDFLLIKKKLFSILIF